MILTIASSWRIITAGMPWLAWRIFSKARWTRRSWLGSVVMTRMNPSPSRCTRAGLHRTVILQRLSASQVDKVSAVKVSLTAGERARMAISTSWSMPNEMSWVSVRLDPVMCARPSASLTRAAASGGHTMANGCPWTRKCPGR